VTFRSRGRLTAFAVAVALTAGGTFVRGGADLPEVKTRGALRVIIAADESPDTFALIAGTRPGFERDLMERFAQLQDIKLEVVRAPGYADRIPMLLRGEGDVIAAIFDTPDRREKVAFTAGESHPLTWPSPCPAARHPAMEDLRA
jgi:membrane-bound lytic murein transglycosylase MltF